MELYSIRNGFRNQVDKYDFLLPEHINLLMDICDEYIIYLSWYAPNKCSYCKQVTDINMEKFNIYIKSNLPYWQPNMMSLYGFGSIDQDTLLDFIEFIAKNARDFKEVNSDCSEHDSCISHLKTNYVVDRFTEEINEVFERCNVLFKLNDIKEVERVIHVSVLTSETTEIINSFSKESELKKLLKESMSFYKNRHNEINKVATEKIWDALERLKTYYDDLDKKNSANKIIEDMSEGQDKFRELFELEFIALTTIGNDFRIRHHETNKTDIIDPRHYDYFFNRCLSLIALAIQYLK